MNSMAAESVLGRKQTDPPPQGNDISSTDDLFQMRKCSGNKVIRLTNGCKKPAEFTGDKRMNLDRLGSLCRRDGSHPEQTGDSVISHTLNTSVMRRHGAGVLTTRTPPAQILRADITINEERDRVFVERGYKIQGQASKTRPSRRMSCPQNVSNNFSNERSRSLTKAMPKRKTRLFAQHKHHLVVKTDDNSRHAVLPKIIESAIETLWTKEENESSGNERNDDMRSNKSSSPRSFNSEKSADEVKLGSNDSKKNVLMSSLVTKSEGNSDDHKEISAYKNKAIETTFHAKQDIVSSRFLDSSPIQNSIEDTWKIKTEGKQICDIDRIHFNASENGLRTRTGGGMQSTKRKTMIIPQRGVKFRPKSKTTSGKDLANQKAPSPTISEEELNLKVLTFLRSNQPTASPETLKLKVAKKTKTILPSNSMPEERRKGRVFINTDTCPSTSHLVTQNRSWYYQDRRGKCRYLRVPESPVPPIEWVFQRDDTF